MKTKAKVECDYCGGWTDKDWKEGGLIYASIEIRDRNGVVVAKVCSECMKKVFDTVLKKSEIAKGEA